MAIETPPPDSLHEPVCLSLPLGSNQKCIFLFRYRVILYPLVRLLEKPLYPLPLHRLLHFLFDCAHILVPEYAAVEGYLGSQGPIRAPLSGTGLKKSSRVCHRTWGRFLPV